MFKKKEEKPVVTATEVIDVHPISHVADSIMMYQKQLAQREVESLDQMAGVQATFEEALQENDKLREQMEVLSEVFVDVEQIASRFDNVKNDITDSVGDALDLCQYFGHKKLNFSPSITYAERIIS